MVRTASCGCRLCRVCVQSIATFVIVAVVLSLSEFVIAFQAISDSRGPNRSDAGYSQRHPKQQALLGQILYTALQALG